MTHSHGSGDFFKMYLRENISYYYIMVMYYTYFVPTPQTQLKNVHCIRIASADTHTHTHTNTNICNFKELIKAPRAWSTEQDRTYYLAPGISLPLPIAVASHFNITQRCAANALLTHQRDEVNSHSSTEQCSPVTAVPGKASKVQGEARHD